MPEQIGDLLMNTTQTSCNSTPVQIEDITKISQDITDFLYTFQDIDINAIVMNISQQYINYFGVDLDDPMKTIQLVRYRLKPK